ncbi:MAG: replication factor C large subunit [archaeon]
MTQPDYNSNALVFTELFKPENLEGFVGNSEIVKEVLTWAREWERGKKIKPLLFVGSNGLGKTLLAYLIAKECKWGLLELNASDTRNKEAIERIVGSAAVNASFDGNLRLILMDEIDGLHSVDRGGSGAVTKILKTSLNPIILTANDIYSNKNLAGIRLECKVLNFRKPNYLSIAKLLKNICEKYDVDYDLTSIQELAKNASGDIRSVLLDLQSLMFEKKITLEDVQGLGFKDRNFNVFDSLKKVFKSKDFKESRNSAFLSDVSNDLMFRWIEENLPRQYTDSSDLAAAFERLSKADIFKGRIIRRQHWGFLRYANDLMTAGVSFSRSRDYSHFTSFQFPTILSKISRARALNAKKNSVAEKIALKNHCSVKRAFSYFLPFTKIMFANHLTAVRQSYYYNFSEEEIAFLLNKKPGSKDVLKVFSELLKLKEKDSLKPKRKPLSSLYNLVKEESLEEVTIKEEPIIEEKQTSLSSFMGG